MKSFVKIVSLFAVATAIASGATSCVSESPFENSPEGKLQINASIKGDLKVMTRTDADYDEDALKNNLVVYVERLGDKDKAGLVRKFKGISSIPESITLPVGQYAVEAWTGDSVSASWNKKFYRCYQPVEIKSGVNEQITLHCNIANVIVSMNQASLEAGISDLEVSFWHSHKGQDNENVLTFTENEVTEGAKGYFMMPTKDFITGAKETQLFYHISGTLGDGTTVDEDGLLEDVEAAHEYKVTVKADRRNETAGGALVKLEIAEIPVIEEKFEIFPAPTFDLYYGSESIPASEQLNLTTGDILDAYLTIIAYKGVKAVKISFSDNCGNLSKYQGINLVNEEDIRNEIDTVYGIEYDRKFGYDKISGSETETILYDEIKLKFKDTFLFSLKTQNASDEEHVITIEVTDGFSQIASRTVRFATTESAVEHPAPLGTVDPNDNKSIDYTLITPYSAVLRGEIYDDAASNYGIKYREVGTENWTEVPAQSVRADITQFSVKVSGLTPGKQYEYKAYCDGFEEKTSRRFTTETTFTIPNAGFEDWSTYEAQTLLGKKSVVLPGAGGNKLESFWGSGNEGAATASKVLTNKSTDMLHSGSYSARLGSDAALGIIAAGNIFSGYYVETDGTNGVLSVGKSYNGSHPSKLKVYANYRPGGGVTVKEGNEKFIEVVKDGTDHGQIYVALTDEPIEIRTNPNNRKLFDAVNDQHVLAYGEVTWKEAFGEDGSLSPVEIELVYNDRAKKKKPTHLVIVCSASKFGDYFCGSSSSVMYLDDFELVYE